MAADSVLAEALARLEHKMDLVIQLLSMGGLAGKLAPVADPGHDCPLCRQQVTYSVDIMNKVVTRKCGCSTGKQAPIDLGAFAPPMAKPRPEDSNGRDEDQAGGDSNRSDRNRRR